MYWIQRLMLIANGSTWKHTLMNDVFGGSRIFFRGFISHSLTKNMCIGCTAYIWVDMCSARWFIRGADEQLRINNLAEYILFTL